MHANERRSDDSKKKKKKKEREERKQRTACTNPGGLPDPPGWKDKMQKEAVTAVLGSTHGHDGGLPPKA